MLIITSDFQIKKPAELLVGQTVITFLAEPSDTPQDTLHIFQNTILPHIAPATSPEQMLMAASLLIKHLRLTVKKQSHGDEIAKEIINMMAMYKMTITNAQEILGIAKEMLMHQPLQEIPAQKFVDGYLITEPSKAETLEKRIADLEAELQEHKTGEWDRLQIREMMKYVKITDIKAVDPETLTAEERDDIYRQEYQRRISAPPHKYTQPDGSWGPRGEGKSVRFDSHPN